MTLKRNSKLFLVLFLGTLSAFGPFVTDLYFVCNSALFISISIKNPPKGADSKDLNFNKVYMRTHRRSGLLISKYALEKLFIYLINFAGVTRQNLVYPKSRFLSHSHYNKITVKVQ